MTPCTTKERRRRHYMRPLHDKTWCGRTPVDGGEMLDYLPECQACRHWIDRYERLHGVQS